jgi:hypothetical protein
MGLDGARLFRLQRDDDVLSPLEVFQGFRRNAQRLGRVCVGPVVLHGHVDEVDAEAQTFRAGLENDRRPGTAQCTSPNGLAADRTELAGQRTGGLNQGLPPLVWFVGDGKSRGLSGWWNRSGRPSRREVFTRLRRR